MNAQDALPQSDYAVGPDLTLSATNDLNGIHLAAAGEIDAAVANAFLARLRDALKETDGVVVVDLAAVTFIDSSGVTALFQAWGDAAGRLLLGTLHPRVRRVLEITALLDQLSPTNRAVYQRRWRTS